MERQKILIDGAWVESGSERNFEIRNPATAKLVGLAPDCGSDDIGLAVAAARRAQPGWWRIPGVEKAQLLRGVAARIRKNWRALSRLMVLETGKPLCEAADCIDWVAA